MNNVNVLKCAALSGLLAVALGAFGAHGLKNLVEPAAVMTWETAARYQFYHAIALLAIAALMGSHNNRFLGLAVWMFIAGMILFSGSLYIISLRTCLPFNCFWLGPVTPLGGLCFIAGWFSLFLSAGKSNTQKTKGG